VLTLRISLTRIRTTFACLVTLDDSGLIETATSDFSFGITDKDERNLCWYLEDYLKYPAQPAPAMAERIEKRLCEVGRQLFTAVFSSAKAQYIWSVVQSCLEQARIEVIDDGQALDVPWEFMRDPETDQVLSVTASAFVRTYAKGPISAQMHADGVEGIRILLAICRPAGKKDVGFRAIARHIVDQFHAIPTVEIDVLRPPTLAQLASVLQSASKAGRPYHIVHFDGHGGWDDSEGSLQGTPRGRIAFEGEILGHADFIDGNTVGQLLCQHGVPILVLNACRSARRDSFGTPGPTQDEGDGDIARSFRSFAQDICEAGVAGVVAMRYNIYVVTAAQFIGDVYAALLGGAALGNAVTSARKRLAERPLREVTSTARPLQDWVVPVVYEASPLILFKDASPTPEKAREDAPSSEPTDRPRFGFLGRDDALFDLDRAFASHPAVLLHGYAGEGKTVTAAEFARWYSRTGGTDGRWLYTSFASGRSILSLIEQVCRVFENVLHDHGIDWSLLSPEDRREVAKGLMTEFRPLWIWDSFELVTDREKNLTLGYGPRAEFVHFLAELQTTGAKVLIVSRRTESWLQDAVFRIALDPMPLMERLQLAKAISSSLDTDLGEPADWLDFLRYTQGNPFTIITVLSGVLKAGTLTKKDIDELVDRLRSGETSIAGSAASAEGEIDGGTAGAAIQEFLSGEFSSSEVCFLATLSLFRQFVRSSRLLAMNPVLADLYPGNQPPDYNIREVVLNKNHPLHPLTELHPDNIDALLRRCMEAGLLTLWKIDGQPLSNFYYIHPAFAWHLTRLFNNTFGGTETGPGRDVVCCYVRAYAQGGSLAQYAIAQDFPRLSMVLTMFHAEEHNIRYALKLAIRHQWWGFIPDIAEGLRMLYRSDGRILDWDRVVAEITPSLLDENLRPLPGREDLWQTLIRYRIDVAAIRRDWRLFESLADSLVAELRAKLADTDNTAHSYSLAQALTERGEALSLLDRRDEALSAIQEAIQSSKSQQPPPKQGPTNEPQAQKDHLPSSKTNNQKINP
jgi:hypothetical protein